MKRLLLAILITVIDLSGIPSAQAVNSYFPLTVGNTWNYKVDNPDGACSLSNEVLPEGRIKSYGCWGANYSYSTLVESPDGIRTVKEEVGGVIYTSSPGSGVIPTNMSVGNTVTTTYTYTDPDGTGSETEKVTVIGVENVTVPAGTFSAVKVKQETTGYSQPAYSWYVAGVGLVKHVTSESLMELTSSSLTATFGSLTLFPTGKDFGVITTNTASTSQTFTLSNSGSANLSVSGFSLLYGTASEFSINTGSGSGGSCGPNPTIVPGGSCTIGATFNPTSVGEKETGLHIYSNDPATPDKIATLNGIGLLSSYTIDATVTGGNGTVNCTAPVYNGTCTCTVTPALGYQLATLTDNGANVFNSVSGNSYIINNVTDIHTINATFEQISFTMPAPIPKTGQTTCYNAAGAVILCTGTGQDGALQSGVAWPNPRFIRTDGVTTVTAADTTTTIILDKLTGLEWLRDGSTPTVSTCTGGTKTWQGALDYVQCLNDNNYQNHNDWRLPNINELRSLANAQETNTASWLNISGFQNVQSSVYWSSSTNANYTSRAWYVSMSGGGMSSYGKVNGSYVWPVRSGQSGSLGSLTLFKTGQTTSYAAGDDGALQMGTAWTTPRFSANSTAPDNGNTITDNLTGLVWSKNADPASAAKTWQEALDYIKTLNSQNYQGHNDWRLPNRDELASLMNFGMANPVVWLNQAAQGFASVQSYVYWSSSTFADFTRQAWYVFMASGDVGYGYKDDYYYVWPVRGGQSGSFGSLTLSPIGKDFGAITTNTASPVQIFTMTNNGSGSLIVSDLSLDSPQSDEFNLNPGNGSGGTCGAAPTIAPGGNCTVNVTFNPTTAGAKVAYLVIHSNDPATPEKLAQLNGTGVSPGYSVTPSAGTYGSITPNTVQSITSGATATFTITPNSGYSVVTPIGGTCPQGNYNPALATNNYTTGPLTANCTVAPAFTLQTFTIPTSVPGGNGTVSCTTPVYNGVCTCTVTPATGYQLATLTDNGVSVFSSVSGNSYTFNNVTAIHTINATFSQQTFTMPVIVPGGNGTVNCTAPVYNGVCTCTITPGTDFQLATLTDDGVNVFSSVSGGSYTISNVTAAHTINATFVHQTFTMPVTVPGGNGTVSCTAPVYNGVCTCTVTPGAGYRLATFTDNGVDVFASVSGNSYTFNNVTNIHTINATFTPQTFTISTSVPGGNGTVSCTAPVYNGVCTCTVTPGAGYQLATLTDNGANVLTSVSGNSYSIDNVITDHSLVATFANQVNGACGPANGSVVSSSPATDLCASGISSQVTGIGPWYWNCITSGNGATASCSANSTSTVAGSVSQADINSCPQIKLYVTAVDQAGSPIAGLVETNFVVREDGILQTPINVTSAAQTEPVSIALTLDYSGSMDGQPITDMQTAAGNFINKLGVLDAAEIVKFSTTIATVKKFTTDKAALATAITANWVGANATTALYDAIYQAISETSVRGGRMAVVAMTDGIDNASNHTLSQVVQLATAKGIPVFTVGLGSVDSAILENLATKTGGQYYHAPDSSELQAIYNRIANIINNQYTITYTTTNATLAARTVTVDISNAAGNHFIASKIYSGCSSLTTTNGVCGGSNGISSITAPTAGLCFAGNTGTVTGTGPWSWTCTGNNGGIPATCSANLLIPGDFDSNGTITITEVQSALRMFLGTKTIDTCVDTNHDANVTIPEVQKVINGFLGM